ncbi:MAG: hypothetical protein AAB378_00730 [Patescibacteria group bacterium]
MPKKIVLVTRDAAPSRCFKRLEPVLRERGFDVVLFIGDGKPLAETMDEIGFAASHASVVVLGMSSSAELARPEIAAGEAAKRAGVPYGFYGDVSRCWGRARSGAWFEGLASGAAFYFGVTQEDTDTAREVFPSAKLIGTGNPLREEMAFPHFTREEVRAKLNIAPEEKLVLVPGGKFAAGNLSMWAMIMDSLASLTNYDLRFQLVLAIHPGDRTPYALDAASKKEMVLYDELLSCSPIPARIINKDILTASDIVSGADIVVEWGSSIGIEGAYQNVPVISLGLEILRRRLERASDVRIPEAVNAGLSELVSADTNKLADTIQRLLTPDGFAPMRERQQKLCPKPAERGAALRKIADAIEDLTKEA